MLKLRTNPAIAFCLIGTLGLLGVWLGSVVNAGILWRWIGLIVAVSAVILVVIGRPNLRQPERKKPVDPVDSTTTASSGSQYGGEMVEERIDPENAETCDCLVNGPGNYDRKYIGDDPTNGRYGDVNLLTCSGCGRRWLHYRAEYEAFTGSGRWIVGLLPDELQMPLTPENAVPILNSLPWYIYGGGFYGPGTRGSGNAPADFP